MNTISVAIAIVTYKSAEHTINCLRSIEPERSTPGLHIRVIVVDNASGDAPPIAQQIETNHWSSWVSLIEAPTNGGFSYGNNLAIRRAYEDDPPDYVYLLNPDTCVLEGAIGTLARFLEVHPEAGIAGSLLKDSDGNDLPFAFRFPSVLSELEWGLQIGLATRILQPWVVTMKTPPVPQPADWVGGASMMIRRAVLDAIGGLDENYFLYFEESDFCFRAKKAGFPTWYVPNSRVMHISGQSTQVTGRKVPKRLPAYWFESRRRYFIATYGIRYAIATDIVTMLAYSIGALKRLLQKRPETGVPQFAKDLGCHSALLPKNRKLAPVKAFTPQN